LTYSHICALFYLTMKKFKRIGILGGTFNPPHLGHLLLAEGARQTLRLEKVLFVPTNLPPHKPRGAFLPAQKRYHMVSLAVGSNPFFEVSDLELKRPGLSYSIETVRAFRPIFKNSSLYFIVGSDFLKEFSGWKDIEKLGRICKFAVASRPSYPYRKLPKNMQVINISALNISSTDIRKRIKAGKSIRYLVPEKVRKYILRNKLYSS